VPFGQPKEHMQLSSQQPLLGCRTLRLLGMLPNYSFKADATGAA